MQILRVVVLIRNTWLLPLVNKKREKQIFVTSAPKRVFIIEFHVFALIQYSTTPGHSIGSVYWLAIASHFATHIGPIASANGQSYNRRIIMDRFVEIGIITRQGDE